MNNVDERVLVSLCPDPVIGVDGTGIIQLFNAAAEKLLGYAAADVVGKLSITSIYPDLDSARQIKRLMFSDECGESGSIEGYEATVMTINGNTVPVRLSAAIVDKDEGSSIGFFHDLTERHNLERQLHKLSITDELTGLYNQRHFYQVLAKELDRSKRYKHDLSLICFDLDNFKKVNDSLGHIEGDRILRTVGELLHEALRLSDIAVRYGGDEFMVLLPDTGIEAAAKTAERIRYLFNTKCPYSVEKGSGGIAKVSMSLGVTETNGSEKPDQVVQRSDLAMYQSKSSGGNRTVLINQHIGDVVQDSTSS
ncbi:sensor domain-containing diguanylate cyclase [Neptuniibacter sp.]|uniref:sensor domain-containing diguanylate cyclase n=1 Tax=Neptuniibacter sp. TaxID=1962643 RepID=UPI00260C0DC5|nr:sensor domain-containing diguanylate cyclase [Neptuniibacter sp.]MCP4596977.1 diguanylate cyclase [Neptuniibacter sp.]